MLPHGLSGPAVVVAQRRLLDELLETLEPTRLIAWYYTPMALAFSRHLSPDVCVYDCMDELSAFQGASPEMAERESELFARADVVVLPYHSATGSAVSVPA